jgi:hypothetical protein
MKTLIAAILAPILAAIFLIGLTSLGGYAIVASSYRSIRDRL